MCLVITFYKVTSILIGFEINKQKYLKQTYIKEAYYSPRKNSLLHRSGYRTFIYLFFVLVI